MAGKPHAIVDRRERGLKTLATLAGGLALVLLVFGISLMLWAGTWHIVPVTVCAGVHAIVIAVTLAVAKPGRLRTVGRTCLLGIFVVVTAHLALPMPTELPWWLHIAALSIIGGGVYAGTAIGVQLMLRRL